MNQDSTATQASESQPDKDFLVGPVVILPMRRREGKHQAGSEYELFVKKDGLIFQTDEKSKFLEFFIQKCEPRHFKLQGRTYYIAMLEMDPFKKTEGDWAHYSPALREAFLTEEEIKLIGDNMIHCEPAEKKACPMEGEKKDSTYLFV